MVKRFGAKACTQKIISKGWVVELFARLAGTCLWVGELLLDLIFL